MNCESVQFCDSTPNSDPLLVAPLLERGAGEVFLAVHAVLVLVLGRDLLLVDLDVPRRSFAFHCDVFAFS